MKKNKNKKQKTKNKKQKTKKLQKILGLSQSGAGFGLFGLMKTNIRIVENEYQNCCISIDFV
jgi:hypothetical protein